MKLAPMKLMCMKSVLAALVIGACFITPTAAFAKKETKEAVVPLAPSPGATATAEPTPEAAVPAPSAPVPDPATANVPDTSNILFMQNMRKIGATIYYLGENLGLHGWFVVKDGQVQIIYTTPDQKALLVGALLSPEGANVSQQQVMVLASSNPEIQKILKGSAAVTGQPPKPPSAASNDVLHAATGVAPAPAKPVAESPSEKFYGELLKAANVTFGKESAPQLIMIMDVNCPHCHETWKNFQPLVEGGKLRVTMVPIKALSPQSELEAANWLSKKDPYEAWKKRVAGDEGVFRIGPQDTEKEKGVFANTSLIKEWGVNQTPTILYHGKNGKVRLIMGEPKSIDEIMSDIR
ncbi:MAG: thioredoxin fold domain-containing protein [Alphaproteobacteria bacterium]|nr:thioredoxin fold domain-containing protein [Alphaproteobacteria bacterium]